MKRPMKRLVLTALLCLAAGSASAQNAAQIVRARAGASCPRCNLFQADFANLTLEGRDFSGARLRQATLTSAVMSRSRFVHSDLRDIDAYGAVLADAEFRGADLTHASLVGAYLRGADFAGAKLEGTNLSGAELQRARGLTQGQLDRACGDPSTRLPRGLHVPACR
jgi:uncharacterized protein YjbI with pentapeptide repeats